MTDVETTVKAPAQEQEIAFEYELPEAPEKVWRALTVPELVAAWLMPNDLKPEQGARFTFSGRPGEGGEVECEVLDIEPQRLIRYSWRDEDQRRNSLDSTVTFELVRTEAGGTHLRIAHSVLPRAEVGKPVLMSAANSNRPTIMLRAA